MIQDYLIVNKKILPSCLDQIIEARNLLQSGKVSSVSEAVSRVGISRSTYYKYKDYVFKPSENMGRKFSLSMILDDQSGNLSEVLSVLSQHKTSIITIHQDIPINKAASVTITLDAKNMNINIEDLITHLKAFEGVHNVQLIAME